MDDSALFLLEKIIDQENNYFFLVEISTKKKLLNFLGRNVNQNSTKEN